MSGSLLLGGEDTGRLDDVLSALFAPGDVCGIPLSEDRDDLSVNDELSVLGVDITLETAVYGIVLEHVDHVIKIDERTTRIQSDTGI